MNPKKSLTLDGLTTRNSIYLLISVFMVLVSAYLTSHFYDIHFPSRIGSGSSLCNINDFFGCDKATNSPLSNLFGIPISFFGIIVGLMGIVSAFISSENLEKTNRLVLLINLIGCIVLFIYSLIVLKSLCPFCTVYYVLSAIAYIMFYKYSDYKAAVVIKPLATYFVLALIPAIVMANNYKNKKEKTAELTKQYIIQFENLKNYGAPLFVSKYKIHKGTENFEDAPLRVTVFSDFQCPFCKNVSDQMPALIKEFGDKINIQYMFYPLDVSCNTKMQGGLHPYACQAAYLSACDESKFAEVHDYIFKNQSKISPENLKKWAKEFNLNESCFTDKTLMDYIQQTLNAGDQYKLKSTPTMVINGRKLEGSLSTPDLISILRAQLK